MRGREHPPPSSVQETGQDTHRLGLARARRPDCRADQIAPGQQPAHQLHLLPGQHHHPAATVRARRAHAARLGSTTSRARLASRGETRFQVGGVDQQAGWRAGDDLAVADQRGEGILGGQQILGGEDEFGLLATPLPGCCRLHEDDPRVREETVGQRFDRVRVGPLAHPFGDRAHHVPAQERRSLLRQPHRAGQQIEQVVDLRLAKRRRPGRRGCRELTDRLDGEPGSPQRLQLGGVDSGVGEDLLGLTRAALRRGLRRPRRLQPLGDQLRELRLHLGMPRRERRQQLGREPGQLRHPVTHRLPPQTPPR